MEQLVAITDGGNGLEEALRRHLADHLVTVLDWYHVTAAPEKGEGKVLYRFKADPKKEPSAIDLSQDLGTRKVLVRGLYRLEKDRLVICIGEASSSGEEVKDLHSKRPTEFKSGPGIQLITVERPGR